MLCFRVRTWRQMKKQTQVTEPRRGTAVGFQRGVRRFGTLGKYRFYWTALLLCERTDGEEAFDRHRHPQTIVEAGRVEDFRAEIFFSSGPKNLYAILCFF